MSRILLADDSPHAQRMGERLLRDEGHEVITLVNGDQVFARLGDIDPDFLILDANLPIRDGYEIARFVKNSTFYRHAAVFLTGSLADPVDDARVRETGADGRLQKPFEAKALNAVLNPLVPVVAERRELRPAGPPPPPPGEEPKFSAGPVEPKVETPAEPKPTPVALAQDEKIRAAVTLALDAAMPKIVDEVTRQVLRALKSK
ncbi:MAG: response regulator [Acidobacteria bacterium]|nr:response regulator [Acidobacteriota bacterium]